VDADFLKEATEAKMYLKEVLPKTLQDKAFPGKIALEVTLEIVLEILSQFCRS
jgi:hypothetical protein